MRSVLHRLAFVFAAIITIAVSSPVDAQSRRAQPEPVTATVVEVKDQGRLKALVVEDAEGNQTEFLLNSKVRLEITAPAGAEALQAGRYVTGQGVVSNEQLFGRQFRVFPDMTGRTPPGKLQKAPPQAGQSQNTWLFSGEIAARQQDADYPQYEVLLIKAGRGAKVFIEQNATVEAASTDPAHIQPGATVQLYGTPLKGGRFNLSRAVIELDEPFGGAESGNAAEGTNAEGAKAEQPEAP